MAYTTLAEVKTFCKVEGTGDDTLLTALMNSAEQIVEHYTGTVFDVASATDQTYTRYHTDEESRFNGRTLYFYDYLATSTGVTITDSPTVIYLPEDGPPYYGCRITDGSWAYPTVTVNGKWGYSESGSVPADIEVAVWGICKWLYDAGDSQSSEMIVTPEGQVLIPDGMPSWIQVLLNSYRKVV